MRTLIVAVIGIALSFAFVFAASHLGKSKIAGAILFIGLWLIFCGFDYSKGIKAGYSAIDELGIHSVLFVLPTISAWVAARFLT